MDVLVFLTLCCIAMKHYRIEGGFIFFVLVSPKFFPQKKSGFCIIALERTKTWFYVITT